MANGGQNEFWDTACVFRYFFLWSWRTSIPKRTFASWFEVMYHNSLSVKKVSRLWAGPVFQYGRERPSWILRYSLCLWITFFLWSWGTSIPKGTFASWSEVNVYDFALSISTISYSQTYYLTNASFELYKMHNCFADRYIGHFTSFMLTLFRKMEFSIQLHVCTINWL